MITKSNTRNETDSPDHRNEEPLVNPLYGIVRSFAWATVICGPGLGLALTPLGGTAATVGWIVGGIFGGVALITTLALWWYAGRIDRRLRAFQDGDYLVHWTYTEDEWLGFAEAELAARRQGARTTFYVLLGIIAFTGLVAGIATAAALYKDQVAAYVVGGLAGAAGGALFGAFCGWVTAALMRSSGRRRYERMRERVGESYIGRDAAYCTGVYCTWRAFGMSLHKIEWLPGQPARLQITIRCHTSKGDMYQIYRFPVPAGKEQEAEEVMQVLTGSRG